MRMLKVLGEHRFAIFTGIIALASFLVRVINLDYNSPFNDEAIYVVIGRLGLFQFDWWSYNVRAWVPGSVFFYPLLTSLAYMSGGMVGSRLLNIFFGLATLEAVFLIALQLSAKKTSARWSGLLAAALLGGAPVALYVSRLAVLDMPSFMFFFFALAFLLMAERSSRSDGKWYFLSGLFLILSFLTKYTTACYFPFIVIYSFYRAKKISPSNFYFWKRYFFLPLFFGVIVYLITDYSALISYSQSQAIRVKLSYFDIFEEIWLNTTYAWLLWLIGSLGMILKKQIRQWLVLTFAASWIPIIHLLTHRYWTLDKHLFLTVGFLAIIAGLGLSYWLSFVKNVKLKSFAWVVVVLLVIMYWCQSYKEAQRYNTYWPSAGKMLAYLNSVVNPGDKVLAQVGAAAILAVYDKTHPENTITFDWFDYRKLKREDAYVYGVRDGYFNFVELESSDENTDEDEAQISNLVRVNLADNYTRIYSEDGFEIFRRVF